MSFSLVWTRRLFYAATFPLTLLFTAWALTFMPSKGTSLLVKVLMPALTVQKAGQCALPQPIDSYYTAPPRGYEISAFHDHPACALQQFVALWIVLIAIPCLVAGGCGNRLDQCPGYPHSRAIRHLPCHAGMLPQILISYA